MQRTIDSISTLMNSDNIILSWQPLLWEIHSRRLRCSKIIWITMLGLWEKKVHLRLIMKRWQSHLTIFQRKLSCIMWTLRETLDVIISLPEDLSQICWINLYKSVVLWLEWVLLSQEYKLVFTIVKILREDTSSITQITLILTL